MKRILSLSLALALAAPLGGPAFAQDVPGQDGQNEKVFIAAADRIAGVRIPAETQGGGLPPRPNSLDSGRDMGFAPISEKDLADLPEPEIISSAPVKLTETEQQVLKMSSGWMGRVGNPIQMPDGKIVYLFGATLPTVICAPLMTSDIELQPGEMVSDVIVGDTARWKIVAGTSGPEGAQSTHLVVKPLDAGLVTTAVITTDRRTYHLKLVSQKEGYTPYVGFLYPDSPSSQPHIPQLAQVNQKIQQQREAMRERQTEVVDNDGLSSVVDIAQLDFGYELKGDASWRPTRVYNDGTRTFIRLPHTAGQGEIPVLLVEKAGEQVLVNYRIRNGALIVDEVFDKAVLIAGVGGSQEKVEITRQS